MTDRDRTLDASRRGFDRWAPTYEEDRRSKRIAVMQDAAIEALELGPQDHLLDVGCGSGAAVRRAAPVAASASGVDLAPKMIERAIELAAGIENVEFRVAASDELPYEDGAFTAVLCTSSFHHYPDAAATVREMERVLAPGGRIVIGDGSGDRWEVRTVDWFLRRLDTSHVKLYRSTELASLLYGVGIVDVAVRKLWSGGYALVRARKPS